MKSPAQELGRAGGLKGGHLRGLSPQDRTELARKAANARWAGSVRKFCACGVQIHKGKEDRSNCYTCAWINRFEARNRDRIEPNWKDRERVQKYREWHDGKKIVAEIKKILKGKDEQ